MTLSPAEIEAIARRVADLIGWAPPNGALRYVDAATLARRLGVERPWVYAHTSELGAVRLGSGRGRLRFDLQHATRALAGDRADRPPAPPAPRARRSPRRGARVDLLPYES
jgi:hypothetical protein